MGTEVERTHMAMAGLRLVECGVNGVGSLTTVAEAGYSKGRTCFLSLSPLLFSLTFISKHTRPLLTP